MVKTLTGIFSSFLPRKIIVFGDYMLDRYTKGQVSRVSPEAPVPVLRVEKEECSPGGAGNAVLNLLSLGATVFAFGRVGADIEGKILKQRLAQEGADTSCLLEEEGYITSVKNRFLASSQQIFRADFEKTDVLSAKLEEQLLQQFAVIISSAQLVAVSDYAKGGVSERLLSSIIKISKKANVPVVVDPKGNDFSKYTDATIIKPNLSEAYAAAKISSKEPLEKAAAIILAQTKAEYLLITRSEEGISLFSKNGKRTDFPVVSKEVKDVTGAGDTVLAMMSVALSNNLTIEQAAELSNVAAGIAIERVGCARISLCDLAHKLLALQSDNKVFDEKHLYALKMVLKDQKFSLLGLKGQEVLSPYLFRSIQKIASEGPLVIYLIDHKTNSDLVSMLASLKEINFVILPSKNFANLTEHITPQHVFMCHKEKLVQLASLHALC